jgi:hypothetical protein
VKSAMPLHQVSAWTPRFISCWYLTAAHGKWSATMECLWYKLHAAAASGCLEATRRSISAQDGRREPGGSRGFRFPVFSFRFSVLIMVRLRVGFALRRDLDPALGNEPPR